jgi:hypothetical protein
LPRHWSHTWQKKKNTKKKQNSNTLNPQPIQNYSTPHQTEKTVGFPRHQMPAPNLLGRCRSTGEQISSTRYSHSYPWNKPAQPSGQTDQWPTKKLNNKQGTEKEHAEEGARCTEHTREWGRSKKLIAM